MARNESNVDSKGYIDTEYSSGDCIKMKSKQYQEENNNNIDELSKDLSEMGCIVDAVKKPPNICIETCVYEEDSDIEKNNKSEINNDEDNYLDEFDEESNSDEEIKVENKTFNKSMDSMKTSKSMMKLSKSCSTTSTNKISTSGRSSDFGSISVPQSRRINMSFTNDRLREIERHNHILLNKILSARNKKSSIPPREPVSRPVPSAAVHRKVQQRRIEHDNMILLKKIQRAKSSSCSIRR